MIAIYGPVSCPKNSMTMNYLLISMQTINQDNASLKIMMVYGVIKTHCLIHGKI